MSVNIIAASCLLDSGIVFEDKIKILKDENYPDNSEGLTIADGSSLISAFNIGHGDFTLAA